MSPIRFAISFAAAIALVFSFAACGKDDSRPGLADFKHGAGDGKTTPLDPETNPGATRIPPIKAQSGSITIGSGVIKERPNQPAPADQGSGSQVPAVVDTHNGDTPAPTPEPTPVQAQTPAQTNMDTETDTKPYSSPTVPAEAVPVSQAASAKDLFAQVVAVNLEATQPIAAPFVLEKDPSQEATLKPEAALDGQAGRWLLVSMEVWQQVENMDTKAVTQLRATAGGLGFSTGFEEPGQLKTEPAKVLMHTVGLPNSVESLTIDASIPHSFSRKDGTLALNQRVVFEAVKGQVKGAVLLVENASGTGQFSLMDRNQETSQGGFTDTRFYVDYERRIRMRIRSVQVQSGKFKVTTLIRASYKAVAE
jgi:hypothetical protein